MTYQWYKDGFVLVQQTRAELNFQPFHYRDEGNYCCRVENSAGDALSNVATLQGARGRSQDIESYLGIDLCPCRTRNMQNLCSCYLFTMLDCVSAMLCSLLPMY